MRKRQRMISFVLTVIGLFLAVAFFSPILVLLNNSFKSLKNIYLDVLAFPTAETFITTNYPDAFEKLEFVKSFGNSFMITVCSTGLILVFCSMAAWVLVRYKTKKSKVIFMMYASATLIPFQCVMLPLVRLMDKLHMMNRPGLVLMYLGFGASLSIILFHGFIKNVPVELEEAARLDGCNMVQTFFLVVLPMLKTIMVTVAMLNVMWIWNDFLLPQLMINKPGWQTLPLKTFLFFGQFSKKWDLATAGLIMCMLPIILFYIVCQKHIVKGVTEGAVKG